MAKDTNEDQDEKRSDAEQPTEIISKDAYYDIRKTILGKEQVDIGRIRIRPFVTNTANVSVKGGATVNLGNYESARVDVMLSVPCYIEEIDEVYEQTKDWVDRMVKKEYDELSRSAKG